VHPDREGVCLVGLAYALDGVEQCLAECVGLHHPVFVLEIPNHPVGVELIRLWEWGDNCLHNFGFFCGDFNQLFLWHWDNAPQHDWAFDLAFVNTPIALFWCGPFVLKELTACWASVPRVVPNVYIGV